MAEAGEIWSRLPLEVVENIFGRLSVYDFVRVGCTCTLLRAFVSSHKPIPSSSVSLLLLGYPCLKILFCKEWWVYVHDGSRDAWLSVSLRDLLPHISTSSRPVASAGGLLCFGSGNEFMVCNPITRSFSRLPNHPVLVDMEDSLNTSTDQAFGMTFDATAGTYEFFIVHRSIIITSSKENFRAVHYSSALSQWREMPPLIMSWQYTLHSNAITFCGDAKLYTLWEKAGSLVICAHCDGIWAEIESPEIESPEIESPEWVKAVLLDAHGSLHMVGGVGSALLDGDEWERTTTVRIWKLHGESMTWVELTRMPSLVFHEFRLRDMNLYNLQWWGKNGVLYMKNLESDILMYDLDRDEWKWTETADTDIDLDGLLFEPSLSASA